MLKHDSAGLNFIPIGCETLYVIDITESNVLIDSTNRLILLSLWLLIKRCGKTRKNLIRNENVFRAVLYVDCGLE